jgi:hypothetical protein
MTTFKTKAELLAWHQKEAIGWHKYEGDCRAKGLNEYAEKAKQAAEMHESAVEVLETVE